MKKGFFGGAPKPKQSPAPTSSASAPDAGSGQAPAALAVASAERVIAAAAAFSLIPVGERARKLCETASKGALRMQATAAKGRHMVATRNVKEGEELLTSDCYATVVAEARSEALCGRCMGPGGGTAPMRCGTCGTRFCEKTCLDDAGAEHVAECAGLAALRKLQRRLACDSDTARLALRALARKALEAPPQDDGEVHWQDVETLLSHRPIAEKSSLFSQRLADAEVLLTLLPPPVRGQLSAEAAAELLLRIRYNSFPIADSAGAAEIGLGLYPAAALLNHSCAPNGALAFAAGGGALSVRAVVDIAAGEEVTFSYIDPLQPRAARQALLKAAYAFDCSCTLCTAPGGEGGAGGDWAMVGMVCGKRPAQADGGDGGGVGGGICRGTVLPPDGRVGEEEEVVCGTCAGRQRAMDLVRCSEAAEANLEACLKVCQGDATQGRATLVAFLESAEAARLSPSHHLLYQAHAALAVACRTMGDHSARAAHLRAALGATTLWGRAPCAQLATLRIALGACLLALAAADAGGVGRKELASEAAEMLGKGEREARLVHGAGARVVEQARAALRKAEALVASAN